MQYINTFYLNLKEIINILFTSVIEAYKIIFF